MESPTRRRRASEKEHISLNLSAYRLPPSCFPLSCCVAKSRGWHSKTFSMHSASSSSSFFFISPCCEWHAEVLRGSFAFFVLSPPPHPSLLLLLLSACLLPNEALRIKCLKDCRHFTRVGAVVQRYATVHSSLKCSSDYCQTCEEHFEAETGVEGGRKKVLIPLCYVSGIRAL